MPNGLAAAGIALLLLAAFGLGAHVVAWIEFIVERKKIRPTEASSRESRSRARNLSVTLVAALASSSIIGFFTNVASEQWATNETSGFVTLFVLTMMIFLIALFAVVKLGHADEDDYSDYPALVRDLRDALDANMEPTASSITRSTHALKKLDADAAKALLWTAKSPRGAHWRQACKAAAIDSGPYIAHSVASSLPKVDSVSYLFRCGRRHLIYTAALSVAFVFIGVGLPWKGPFDFVVVGRAVALALLGIALWLGAAAVVSRYAMISRLAWSAVGHSQSADYHALIRRLQVRLDAQKRSVRGVARSELAGSYLLSNHLLESWRVLQARIRRKAVKKAAAIRR